MKAIVIESHGAPDVIKIKDIEEPICPSEKVRVRVRASSINHLDIWVRKGIPGLRIDFPRILGSDASGTVTEVGSDVDAFKVGDNVVVQPGIFDADCPRVMEGSENLSPSYGIIGEMHDGIQSEYIVLDPVNLHHMPDRLSFSEASSMALVFMTSFQMLIKRARIRKSDSVLIYGATSGVGGAAIQIAKDMGCNVFTTVGDKTKIEYAESLGADAVFLHDSTLYSSIKNHIGNNRIDVVFEHIGSKTWDTSMKLLGRGGRVVTCGATTGHDVNVNLRHLFSKQQSIIGSTMGDIDTFKKVQEKIKQNIYIPFLDKTYHISDIKSAHKRIEDRENLGKVILSLD